MIGGVICKEHTPVDLGTKTDVFFDPVYMCTDAKEPVESSILKQPFHNL